MADAVGGNTVVNDIEEFTAAVRRSFIRKTTIEQFLGSKTEKRVGLRNLRHSFRESLSGGASLLPRSFEGITDT
jgi:hypothetical protein